MDEIQRSTSAHQSVKIWQMVLLVLGGVLIALVIFPPLFTAEAAPEITGREYSLDQTSGEYPSTNLDRLESRIVMLPRPTYTPTPTATNTATNTDTPTATDTPTPTDTATPTQTLTGTVTQTPTITQTATQTRTPTATGTITPSPALSVIVRPSEARIGEALVFTIAVRNNGTAPMYDVFILSTSFPTTVNLVSVVLSPSSHGVVTIMGRSFSVALGDVFPGDIIDLTVNTRVNSTLTTTITLNYPISMNYDTTRTLSASVNYKLIASTLPGTGDLPLDWRQRAIWEGVKDRWLWSGLGLVSALLGIGTRKRNRFALWLGLLAVALLIVGFAGGCSTSDGINGGGVDTPYISPMDNEPTRVPYQPASAYSTPEVGTILTLPDFPIPTPVISVTPADGEAPPDTSPVVRIVIPALFVDTVVKYVPFDGFTLLIAGLRDEVAWMGNTSWPGLGSNTALAGHVTVAGWGDGPFRYLEELPVGEVILLYTEHNIYTYHVRETRITDSEDLSVTAATENSQVTLITCVDWDDDTESYLNRLIVFGDLVRVEPVVRGSLP